MQIAILNGVYGKDGPDLARSYPINLKPVAHETGISRGYLRVVEGATQVFPLSGPDRGAIEWRGQHYRVIGTSLVIVGDTLRIVGDVGAGGAVSFAYSFDLLAVASGGRLYYWDGQSIRQVTDTDLGTVLDVVWIDGYFMTTDGTSLVVTELADPFKVDPLKYGSSEADPDPVVGLLEQRGEVYALNGNTIEVFVNRGSTGFPFVRQRGAQIPKGCVGPKAFTRFVETFAFCGSGRAEQPAVYLAGAGQGIRISPPELDAALASLQPSQLAAIELEARNGGGAVELLVHLATETWVYHWTVSQQFDAPVWSRLAGGADLSQPSRPRHHLVTGGRCWCSKPGALGYMDAATAEVFGEEQAYRFDTPVTYNAGEGAVIYEIELVALTGWASQEAEPYLSLSWSDDGVTYSAKRAAGLGRRGDRSARPSWRRLGALRNWRVFRFEGRTSTPVSFARLEAKLEGLNNGAA